jgi:phage repressor protein C with HTH and peptisase S24 domain
MAAKKQVSVEKKAFSERMKSIADLAGNATRLSETSGISRRSIGAYLAGTGSPSRERLVKLAQATGVSVEWLSTGSGKMKDELSEVATTPVLQPATSPQVFFTYLPSGDRLELPRRVFDELGAPPVGVPRPGVVANADIAVLENKDDAMVPQIQPGDRLLIDKTRRGSVGEPGIFLLWLAESYRVRRYERSPDGRGHFVQDNAAGAKVAMPPGEQLAGAVIGAVIGVVRPVR